MVSEAVVSGRGEFAVESRPSPPSPKPRARLGDGGRCCRRRLAVKRATGQLRLPLGFSAQRAVVGSRPAPALADRRPWPGGRSCGIGRSSSRSTTVFQPWRAIGRISSRRSWRRFSSLTSPGASASLDAEVEAARICRSFSKAAVLSSNATRARASGGVGHRDQPQTGRPSPAPADPLPCDL